MYNIDHRYCCFEKVMINNRVITNDTQLYELRRRKQKTFIMMTFFSPPKVENDMGRIMYKATH